MVFVVPLGGFGSCPGNIALYLRNLGGVIYFVVNTIGKTLTSA
jgi:hypothetical protein